MAHRVSDDFRSSDRLWLGLLILGVGFLSALIVLPYLQYVLVAVLLAYVLAPLQRRLEPHLGATVAALVLLVVAMVAILIPVAVLAVVAVQQGAELANAIVSGELGTRDLEARLAQFGLEVDLEATYDTIREPAGVALRGFVDEVAMIVGGIPEFLIGVTVLLFVLYSLLRDGDRLVEWLQRVLPLRPALQTELLVRIDRLMWVSIVANAAVALVQAALTVIGLAIVGVPGLAFFGILTFILALLPLIGASVVWVPVAVYLLATGRLLSGAFLFLYGALIVSLSDNYLRPLTVGRGADLSVALVIVGLFGGVAVFGFVGLFFGPILLGTLKTALELYARERDGDGLTSPA